MYLFEASYWNRKSDKERTLSIEVDSSIFTDDVIDHDATAFRIAFNNAMEKRLCSEMLTGVKFIVD